MPRSKKVNIKEPAHGACMAQLTGWVGINPPFLENPSNAFDIFETYSRATGCTFQEALELAAIALLKDFKDNAVEA